MKEIQVLQFYMHLDNEHTYLVRREESATEQERPNLSRITEEWKGD